MGIFFKWEKSNHLLVYNIVFKNNISTDSILFLYNPPLAFRPPFSFPNESSFHRLHKSQKKLAHKNAAGKLPNIKKKAAVEWGI